MRDFPGNSAPDGQRAAREFSEPLMSIEDVSRALNLSVKTVRRLVARGSLPCYRIGRLVRFIPGDVFRWLQAQKEV